MPRKRNSQTLVNKETAIVFSVIMLIFLCLFLITGIDPLGLFGDDAQPTPTSSIITDSEWYQVYFTDPIRINDPDNPRDSIEAQLIGRINHAQKSIHIAAFEFNLTPIADALLEAHQRGVDIKWITDDEYGLEVDEDENHGQFAMLEEAGIPIKDDGSTAYMHNKFIIFDEHIVWTGSMNLSRNDIFRNNNNVIVIESPLLGQIYEREFAEMWDGAFGPSSPSTVFEQSITLDGTPIQVLFASEDMVLDKLIQQIEGANESIIFMAFSFTHDDLTNAMLKRAQQGIDIRGIFETRGSETEFSALPVLFCQGLSVRQDGNPGTFHHKVIVIDDKITITGSLNFSRNADENNDENILLIDNPDIASLYRNEFDQRWAEANPPDKQAMDCN
jgi:phosphatidylserine/phosphatidylglycerophosphate/cardiolipin synthase-like enzyme